MGELYLYIVQHVRELAYFLISDHLLLEKIPLFLLKQEFHFV